MYVAIPDLPTATRFLADWLTDVTDPKPTEFTGGLALKLASMSLSPKSTDPLPNVQGIFRVIAKALETYAQD
jgi:hypothetical protein